MIVLANPFGFLPNQQTDKCCYLAHNCLGAESGKKLFPVEYTGWALGRQDFTEIASPAEGKHHKMWKDISLKAASFYFPRKLLFASMPGSLVSKRSSLMGALWCSFELLATLNLSLQDVHDRSAGGRGYLQDCEPKLRSCPGVV